MARTLGRTHYPAPALHTTRPPRLQTRRVSRPQGGGGPPTPPFFWRGGGGGGGPRWPKWKVLLLCLVCVAVSLGMAFVLWRGVFRFPASVIAGLLVLAVYWIRSRPLQPREIEEPVPVAMLWAAGAGALTLPITNWPSEPIPWWAMVASCLGIGGAVGLMAWLAGHLLIVHAVGAWLLIKELRQPPGWESAA
jgi:hypothetical protein